MCARMTARRAMLRALAGDLRSDRKSDSKTGYQPAACQKDRDSPRNPRCNSLGMRQLA
jgi:hypothetical protein